MGLAIPRRSLEAALYAIDLRRERKLSFRDAIAIAADVYGRTKKEISRLVRKGKAYLINLMSGEEKPVQAAEEDIRQSFTEDEKKLADPWAKLDY